MVLFALAVNKVLCTTFRTVYLKLEMHYPGDSFRPDAITAETTIDGRQEVKVFLNDKY